MAKTTTFFRILFFVILSTTANAQSSEASQTQQPVKYQYIGSSLTKILFTSLINANYSFELNTHFTPYVEGGYGINVANTSLLTWNHKTPDDVKISGGFLKLGMLLNLRQNAQKKCFTHVGVFFNNALVNEKRNEEIYDDGNEYEHITPINHTVYVPALSATAGLDVKMWKQLWANFDVQFSFPKIAREEMRGHSIPGMGTSRDREIYIMLTFNLKYQLPL